MRLNLSTPNISAACLLQPIFPFLQPPDGDQSHSQLSWKIVMGYSGMPLLSMNIWSIWLWVFRSGEVQLYLRMSVYGDIGLLRSRSFDVSEFTILTPLSLLTWCRLSFPIVGWKINSLPNFALKSRNTMFIWYLGIWSKTCSNSS